MDNTNIRKLLSKQYFYVSQLNNKLMETIQDYTGSSYEILNKRLRNGEYLGEYENMVVNLDQAFDGVFVTEHPIIVYRGIDSDEFSPKILSYVSTTYDITNAYKFVGKTCCLLRITVSAGSKILPIEDISEEMREKEILLPRFGRFEITSYHHDGPLLIYDLVYLPEKSVEISQNVPIPTRNQINHQLGDDIWADRITSMIDMDEIEMEGSVEGAVYYLLNTTYKGQSVPEDAIRISISRLRSLYP